MKWFTCTPVEFGGGADFFARDSGLLSRGFQAIGVESRAVMPGTRKPEDEPVLIRTVAANLESPDWWRRHELDGVVLYAWGLPRFLGVATAIRRAGIRLVLNQDSGGLASPLCGISDWLRERWLSSARKGRWQLPFFAAQVAHALTLSWWTTERSRARHLQQGDWIGMVTPGALSRYRRMCRIYGGRDLARRVVLVPHPVTPDCRYQAGDEKRDEVVAVGRWTDEAQKRPRLLVAALEAMLGARPRTGATIIGQTPAWMSEWHGSLPPEKSSRVRMVGAHGHDEVVKHLRNARVLLCPSAFEGYPIVAAEAVCCGATVVSFRSASLPGPRWFAHGGGGRLAAEESGAALGAALVSELEDWDRNFRDPRRLSDRWTGRLHAAGVARRILELDRKCR